MNRKLHNTSIALTASVSVLILGLAAGMPITPPQAEPGAGFEAALAEVVLEATRTAELAARSADAAEAGAAAASANAASVDSILDDSILDSSVLDHVRRNHGARRSRQSMAMPYFSFAPRG